MVVQPTSTVRRSQPFLQVIAVSLYLITWVANGEMLQAVTDKVYNKPAAITWFSYNFMCISLLFAATLKTWQTNDASGYEKENVTNPNLHWTKVFWKRLIQEWAGSLGVAKAMGVCVGISHLLLALNVFMVLGLQCVSVSLSNAIYQLQTPMTIVLSIVWLNNRFYAVQGVGMILSLVGVALIVVPPLDGEGACIKGTWQTIFSSIIGSIYLTSWKWLDRKNTVELDAREGFLDAHMTLGMIGVCNLLAGWPLLIVLHVWGLETLEWPDSTTSWTWLISNGIVEYLFDASCAAAIYITSPIVVSVAAPLTIPLSIFFDRIFRLQGNNISLDPKLIWGGVFVLMGTFLIETKPSLNCFRLIGRRQDLEKLKQEDTQDEMIV
jgi:hypothetical protein